MLSEKHHIHHRTKKILSYILSFFVMICTITVSMCITIKSGLLNPNIIESSMHKGNYYEYRLGILNKGIEDLLAESGLPKDLAKDVVTDGMMSIDTSSYISNALKGKPVAFDTSALEAALVDNVTEYLKKQGITPDEKLERYISDIASQAKAIYKSNISFEFIAPYMSFASKYDSIIKSFIIGSIAVIIICTALLLLLHRRKYRAVRFCTYGVLAGSVVTACISLLAKKALIGVISGEGAYYNVMRMYISDAFMQGMYVAIGDIMMCGILIFITYVMKRKVI